MHWRVLLIGAVGFENFGSLVYVVGYDIVGCVFGCMFAGVVGRLR